MQLTQILEVLVYAVTVLVFTGVAQGLSKALFGPRNKADHGNLALSFRKSGLYVAAAVAMMAALGSGNTPTTFGSTLSVLAINGFAITLLLLLAQYINDKFIVTGLDNSEAVAGGNTAVGITEFGSMVATGLIAYGSFLGVRKGVWIPAIAFFFLGQLTIVLFFRLFDVLHPVDLLGEIRKGNAAAATIVAGMFIGLGLVIKTAVSGEFVSWQKDIVGFAFYAAVGIALLLGLYWLFTKLFLRGTVQTDEINSSNVALALKAAVGEVSIALVLSTLI